MLAVHSQPEQKENQQRPVNRTYYYIDYRATIDAIKYRMWRVTNEVEIKMNKDADTKGYACPRCDKRFTVLEAVTLEYDDAGLFICDRCSNTLIEDDDSSEAKVSQERLGRMMEQTRKIIGFLKEVDERVIPENTFETAFANAVPVPKQGSQLSGDAAPAPVVVSKKTTSNQPSLEISITSTSEKSAAELAAEQARKQQQAEKNALPIWHTQSTVDNAATNAGIKEQRERDQRAKDGIGLTPDLAKLKEEEQEKSKDAAELDDEQGKFPPYGFTNSSCSQQHRQDYCCLLPGTGPSASGRGRRRGR